MAQILRLDKRDLKKLEELVRQDSKVSEKLEDAMYSVQAEKTLHVMYKVSTDQHHVFQYRRGLFEVTFCCRASGLRSRQRQLGRTQN